jgi:hypothetical protein
LSRSVNHNCLSNNEKAVANLGEGIIKNHEFATAAAFMLNPAS